MSNETRSGENKMKQNIFTKTLVIGIIMLFVGTSTAPCISVNPNKKNTIFSDEVNGTKEINTLYKGQNLEQKQNTEVKLLSSDNSGIEIENSINIDDLIIEPESIGNENYHTLFLSDYSYTTEIGKPQLPVKTELLAIPESPVDIEIEILSTEHTTMYNYNINPVPNLIKIESLDGYSYLDEVFSIDEDFYSTDGFYPERLVEIERNSYIRDLRVAQLVINPIQYNPVTNELRIYTTLTVEIKYNQNTESWIKSTGPFDNICSDIILNYNHLKTTSTHGINSKPTQGNVSYPDDLSDTSNSADYLIITNDPFYTSAKQDYDNGTFDNKLNELAHHRAIYNRFDVAVVSVNDSFIGGNSDTNIKDFIKYVFSNWSAPQMDDNHVGYILLVGDTPFVTTHLALNTWGSAIIAVDRWYGCMQDDLLPDIMIGRFSVDNQTELNIITNKTIQYEQNPVSGDWHTKVMMGRGTIGAEHYYRYVKEELLESEGWQVSEVFRNDYNNINSATNDVIENINEGRGIIRYYGHGNILAWEIFNSVVGMNQLINGRKLPIIYSMGCDTGKFQDDIDCLGELFLNKPDGGGIIFFGSSNGTSMRPGFTLPLFESVIKRSKYIVGDIIADAILRRYHDRKAYPEYNLLGDPALNITGGVPIVNVPGPYEKAVAEKIHFNSSLIGGFPPYTYHWDFGDGNSSKDSNPVHNYSKVGNYSITMRVTDSKGTYSNDTTYIIIRHPRVFNVDKKTVYWAIQDAIDAADFGNIIEVRNDVYNECIEINKPLTLQGEDKNNTIIDSNHDVVKITADNVSISGFTIQNSNNVLASSGLKISSDYCEINGNIIKNNVFYAIYLKDLLNCNITNNIISNNYNGIYIDNGSKCSIIRNLITSQNGYGIFLDFSVENSISDNIISEVTKNSIKLRNSNNNFIGYNTIFENDLSIFLWHSKYNTITTNILSNNGDYGIFLEYASVNTIKENSIYGHDSIGIWLWHSSSNNVITNNEIALGNFMGIATAELSNNNKIYGNDIIDNEFGLVIISKGNHMYHNNFIRNNIHVANNTEFSLPVYSNKWDNDYPSGGNYWDDYTGIDHDSDGIGDDPYDIPGGSYQDLYPLMEPYNPLPDLIITNFSIQHLNDTVIMLKAAVMNNGTEDTRVPFQISFYGYTSTLDPLNVLKNDDFKDAQINIVTIGTVEIFSLSVGETVESMITWEIYPDLYSLCAFADSLQVIEESNERNNYAFFFSHLF